MDHIVPFARGGNDSDINLLTSCQACNLSKGSLLLPVDTIKELQEGIIVRTKEYEEHLSKNPLLTHKKVDNTFNRPSKLLSRFPKIVELATNRSIHPGKEHHIVVNVDNNKLVSFEYKRYFKNDWENVVTVKNNKTFIPLSITEYTNIIEASKFDIVDKTNEMFSSVEVKTNSKGLYLVKLRDLDGSFIVYSFWMKAKGLIVHINNNDESNNHHSFGDYYY